MSWVRAASLEGYIDVARSVGLDPHRMLWRAGINPAVLGNPERLIAGRAAAYLLESSAVDAQCPHFALLMAARRTASTLGPVSLLMQHEETLGDVIAAIVRYQNVIAEAVSLSFEDLGETVILHVRLMLDLDHDERQAIDLAMAAIVRALTDIGGDRWCAESMHFIHKAPADLSLHHRVFRCPLEFNSQFNGFVFAKQLLGDRNASAEPQMGHYARNYLEILRKPAQNIAIGERIRRSLHARLPMGRTTLDQVGEDLGMNPRTLQRQLEQEGLSFAMVLSEARRELTLRYLQAQDQPLNAIAGLVGYGSASSFTRWFRGEFGVPPQVWRSGGQRGGAASAVAH